MQGYKTENQLIYFKKCYDHHKFWDLVCNIHRQAMAMGLIWTYVKNCPNPLVEDYLAWVKRQKDPFYQIKFEQIFIYLQAIIINYRATIKNNNLLLKRAVKRVFLPVWSERCHSIYCLIDASDEIQLIKLNSAICNIIDKYSVVSRSELINQYQGLNTILEEINKTLKLLIPPIPQECH
ncbi:hypothetical protein F8M41_000294 [Gigaspora margarita]|uniref:Uncharacterized protein n=1 Tax=Gigaspora margarita TaxID=4874 RepID=A0A8H3XGG6_GIGMA|nr:hypothetical protein F8M41_000294 [Gigaspora margarita]